MCDRPDVQWIITVLRTAEIKTLQSICLEYDHSLFRAVQEFRQEWLTLDHLLVQIWASRSLPPKLSYYVTNGLGPVSFLGVLLPLVSTIGDVDLIGSHDPWWYWSGGS